MNETVLGVVEAIRENRTKFEEFCCALSEEQLMRPVPESTWVVRDFAAHLGTLDTAMARWFGDAAWGVERAALRNEGGGEFDVDAFNDAEVARRRDWPLKRVFEEASANRERLIETMSRLTQDQIDAAVHFGGDRKRGPGDIPLKLFLAGWAQHDPIHVADMLKALPEFSGDAELAAWVGNPFVKGYQAAMRGPERAQ